MTFDPTKPVQTRDGRKARILCTDLKGREPYTIVATHRNKSDEDVEYVSTFTAEGRMFGSEQCNPNDLVNIPQRHVHADLMILAANDSSLKFEFQSNLDGQWLNCRQSGPGWIPECNYRVKE